MIPCLRILYHALVRSHVIINTLRVSLNNFRKRKFRKKCFFFLFLNRVQLQFCFFLWFETLQVCLFNGHVFHWILLIDLINQLAGSSFQQFAKYLTSPEVKHSRVWFSIVYQPSGWDCLKNYQRMHAIRKLLDWKIASRDVQKVE